MQKLFVGGKWWEATSGQTLPVVDPSTGEVYDAIGRGGQVFINTYGAGGGVELPFGGMKKSGHGREKGFLALEEFSVVKTIVRNFAE